MFMGQSNIFLNVATPQFGMYQQYSIPGRFLDPSIKIALTKLQHELPELTNGITLKVQSRELRFKFGTGVR